MNPFATDQENAVSSIGERALIASLQQWLGDVCPPSPQGIGDDCAIINAGSASLLITTDPVIYGHHFDDSLSPQQVAAKLVNRNLSDIAAMGGLPRFATISLAIDPSTSIDWIQALYQSIREIAKQQQFTIVGGDVSSAKNMVSAFLTMGGTPVESGKPLQRHHATAGSHVYATGTLGGTRLAKHYAFAPRLAEGQWLAKRGECLSCTDLSDGLGKDFTNLLAPCTAMVIDCARLPISEDAITTSKQSGKHPLYHAFNDGEDFELLFAIAQDAYLPSFESAWRKEFDTSLSRIGQVRTVDTRDDATLILQNAPSNLQATGYEHLS